MPISEATNESQIYSNGIIDGLHTICGQSCKMKDGLWQEFLLQKLPDQNQSKNFQYARVISHEMKIEKFTRWLSLFKKYWSIN